MSEGVYEKVEKCYAFIRGKTSFEPEIALVLGSGLGDFADNIEVEGEIDYEDIPGFPVSTAPSHAGRFIFGYLLGRKIICMKGRVHFYEGYPLSDVVLPVRVMRMMGAKILILTNASGGIGDTLRPGDFMLVTDHISSFVPNPLRGANIGELGVRFPDMSKVYDQALSDHIRAAAKALSIELKEGVYLQTAGPSFESPAEIRMFKTLGADAVGMSTVVEAIAANHMGMRICGISLVANLAAGIAKHKLTEEELLEAGAAAALNFEKLIIEAVRRF
ncbi:MAG: purine-nucleoside phosphorylase [Lachnospiraceae bacterium]|nr:purine-nucleoside phosphorylase [Lachnospiraceae bacterium]